MLKLKPTWIFKEVSIDQKQTIRLGGSIVATDAGDDTGPGTILVNVVVDVVVVLVIVETALLLVDVSCDKAKQDYKCIPKSILHITESKHS